MSRFCFPFSNLHNLLSANEKDQFWSLTNQNGGNQIYANWKKKAKTGHTVCFSKGFSMLHF